MTSHIGLTVLWLALFATVLARLVHEPDNPVGWIVVACLVLNAAALTAARRDYLRKNAELDAHYRAVTGKEPPP